MKHKGLTVIQLRPNLNEDHVTVQHNWFGIQFSIRLVYLRLRTPPLWVAKLSIVTNQPQTKCAVVVVAIPMPIFKKIDGGSHLFINSLRGLVFQLFDQGINT